MSTVGSAWQYPLDPDPTGYDATCATSGIPNA